MLVFVIRNQHYKKVDNFLKTSKLFFVSLLVCITKLIDKMVNVSEEDFDKNVMRNLKIIYTNKRWNSLRQ